MSKQPAKHMMFYPTVKIYTYQYGCVCLYVYEWLWCIRWNSTNVGSQVPYSTNRYKIIVEGKPLVMWCGLVNETSIRRCSFFYLHVRIVKHHMNYNTQPIQIHLKSHETMITAIIIIIWNAYYLSQDSEITWNVQGLFSCISMQRKPDVLLSPTNLVPLGKRLISIPLPQSTRHSPWIFLIELYHI